MVMEEGELLAKGLDYLRTLVPPEWSIEDYVTPGVPIRNGVTAPIPQSTSDTKLITVKDSTGNSGWTEVLVEARKELSPGEAKTVLTPQVELMRSLRGEAAVLVIAPWLSAQTRAVLEERGYGYLDLTGNAKLQLYRPALFINKDGAKRDPNPRRSVQGVSGPRAGRLVRLLTEFRPPYRATELSQCSGLSISYVSRLIDALEALGLLSREGRFIMEVDWVNLLRARAEQYAVLKSNEYVSMLAPAGVQGFLDQIQNDRSIGDQLILTGSAAASKIAPVTIGGQLMGYVRQSSTRQDLTDFGERAGLLSVGQGANVVLLAPADPATLTPYDRSVKLTVEMIETAVTYAPISQIILDCLSGPGRMPAEGEAVLAKLIEQADFRPTGLPSTWKMIK